MIKIVEVIIFSFIISRIHCQDEYCYSEDNSPYDVFFSTLTSYRIVKDNVLTYHISDCEPIFTWAVIKCRDINVTELNIDKLGNWSIYKHQIEKNYEKNRSKLCEADYKSIIKWSNFIDEKLPKKLKREIVIDNQLLASNLRVYLDLSLLMLRSDIVDFQSINDKSAQHDMHQFYDELFDAWDGNRPELLIKDREYMFPVKKDCPNWSPNTKEVEAFYSSSYMQQMCLRVSTRLGYLQPLTWEDIEPLYRACAFDKFMNESSPLCAVFSPEDMKVIEYAQDLKHYYEFGYGNPSSEKLGCLFVDDMLASLNKAATKSLTKLKGSFYFVDSETIGGLLVKLGLYRDVEPLKHSNFLSMKETRLWRSSLIDPATSNFIVILYDCGRHQAIDLFVNERAVQFPGCTLRQCSYETFKNKVLDIMINKECDRNFCSKSNSNFSCSKICMFSIIIFCFVINFFN